MRRPRLPTALLPVLLAACGPPPGLEPRAGGATLRLASWNVHDLFDEEDRLLPPGALDEVPRPAEVEAKLDRVAAVLSAVDADVVLLQEVETEALLERLARRAGYPVARLEDGPDARGLDVGILSRRPLAGWRAHRPLAEGAPVFPRDPVEAWLEVAGARVVLLGAHLSSRLSDPSGTRRAGQAAALRSLAEAARAGAALVVVGGDLNDEAGSPSLAPLLGDGAWRDAAAGLPATARWTWSDGGASRAALDHLALPVESGAALLSVRVVGGAAVAAASDHRPLVIDLAPAAGLAAR